MNELYGEFNPDTLEWKDGLIGSIFRAQVSENNQDEKWTVCDGPVDALWIENMNTVLDDNKLLTLINGERIKMNSSMHMLFEVADLAVASPATVSRCGMVYMDVAILGWKSYVAMWIRRLPSDLNSELKEHISNMINLYVEPGLRYVRKFAHEYLKSVDLNLVISLCRLLETYINNPAIDRNMGIIELKNLYSNLFVFSYVWSLGGNLADGCQDGFDTFFKDLFDSAPIEGITLPTNSIFSYFVDLKNSRSFVPW